MLSTGMQLSIRANIRYLADAHSAFSIVAACSGSPPQCSTFSSILRMLQGHVCNQGNHSVVKTTNFFLQRACMHMQPGNMFTIVFICHFEYDNLKSLVAHNCNRNATNPPTVVMVLYV